MFRSPKGLMITTDHSNHATRKIWRIGALSDVMHDTALEIKLKLAQLLADEYQVHDQP